jgi:uroporphyrinogen decarboxylase
MEFGYWDETIRRWHGQGLPSHLTTNAEVEEYLGLEGYCGTPLVPARNGLFPPFEKTILEEKDDRRIVLDEEGNTVETLPSETSMPRYIRFGLVTKSDWERYRRERLDSAAEGRVGDVKEAVLSAHSKGLPILLDAGSLYGWIRNWMGLEGLSIALLTERELVENMMDHLVELTMALIEKALPAAAVDGAKWWEDMCYNKGPLLSPRLFAELMVPRYKVITAALRKYGVDVHILDCDGRIDELVPGWLEAGINCMFPLEAAHTDAWKLRKEYGERVLLFGGVDKLALIRGKPSIDRELDRLNPLVELGGYIPCLDHRVPPDVTLDNYLYYLERKREIL